MHLNIYKIIKNFCTDTPVHWKRERPPGAEQELRPGGEADFGGKLVREAGHPGFWEGGRRRHFGIPPKLLSFFGTCLYFNKFFIYDSTVIFLWKKKQDYSTESLVFFIFL